MAKKLQQSLQGPITTAKRISSAEYAVDQIGIAGRARFWFGNVKMGRRTHTISLYLLALLSELRFSQKLGASGEKKEFIAR